MKKFVFIACFFCYVQQGAAQELPPATEQQLENLSELTEDETEDDSYVQQLQYYQAHPLNLNTATAEELQTLNLLSPLQVAHFIAYRKLFQNLISLYELQAVPLWDVATIRNLLPFVTISSPVRNIGSRFAKGEHAFLFRNTRLLQKQKGFNTALPTHFAGDQNHVLFRYKYQYKNELQYGVVGDKDAGEAFFKNGQRSGFDFYSLHFFARKLGVVKAVALGDFTVNMGQGLIQWQALAFKKSAEPLAVVRQGATLAPHYSADEFYFHRGAGITLQKGACEATVFASLRRINANVDGDSIHAYFTSFATSGLHRTPSEIKDKASVQQRAFGGRITLHGNRFNISANAVQYHFSKPLQKQDEPYTFYAINGNAWHNISTDYNFSYRNFYFFGEAATDKRGSTAFVHGVLASLDPKVDVSIVHRQIPQTYQALYGNAFTEGIAPTNEHGFYTGITIRPSAAWRINSYADFFKSPWLKYRVDAPSAGQDYLLQLTFQPDKKLEAYARFRQEQKVLNELTSDSIVYFIAPKKRQNFRLNISYQFNRLLSIKARSEVMLYDLKNSDTEKGFLLYAEAAYELLKKLKGNLRLHYFHTDGYNSRIYAYESDVLYSYSVPAFFGKGFRYYLNLQYDVFKKCSVWLRWSQTVYKKGETIGSGLTSIAGNTRSEIKCQASYRF